MFEPEPPPAPSTGDDPATVVGCWHDGDQTALITKHRGRNGNILGLVLLPRELGKRMLGEL